MCVFGLLSRVRSLAAGWGSRATRPSARTWTNGTRRWSSTGSWPAPRKPGRRHVDAIPCCTMLHDAMPRRSVVTQHAAHRKKERILPYLDRVSTCNLRGRDPCAAKGVNGQQRSSRGKRFCVTSAGAVSSQMSSPPDPCAKPGGLIQADFCFQGVDFPRANRIHPKSELCSHVDP